MKKTKKMLSVILAISMVMVCFGGFAVFAEGAEFFKNGNLASINETTGVPTGWGISGGTIGTGQPFEIINDIPDGSTGHSIKMTKGASGLSITPDPLAVTGVIPGETYKLSAWTKNYVHAGWGVLATVNFFPQDLLRGMISTVNLDFPCTTKGASAVWEYHEVSFTVPQNATMVTVSYRITSTSSVAWHNLSLKGDRLPNSNLSGSSANDVMVNGSFETKSGGIPTGWNLDATTADSFVTGSAYDGTTSLLLDGAGESITSDAISLEKGKRYTVSAYIKSSVADAAKIMVIQEGADAQTSKTFGATGGTWQKVSHSFIVDQSATGVKIGLGAVAEDTGLEFDMVTLTGDNNVAENGSFEELSAGVPSNWTINGATWVSALKTDGTIDGGNYINLPVSGNSVTGQISGISNPTTYELKVNYKSSVSGAAQVDIETPGYTNKTTGDFIFNRLVNYNLNFASSGGAWKVIKFNITPADGATVINVKLAAAVDDATLCFDNLTLEPTTNLFSNGDFEGAEIVSATAPGLTDANAASFSATCGIATNNMTYMTDAAGAYKGERYLKLGGGATEPFAGQYIPVEPGATYKLTTRVKSADALVPASFWQSNSLNGLAFGQGTKIAMSPISTTDWCYYTRYIVAPTVMPGTGTSWIHRDIQIFFRMNASSYVAKTYNLDNITFEKVETDLKFYNDNGDKISSVTPGGRVRVNYMKGTETTDAPINLILALYSVENGTEKLVNIVTKEGTAIFDKPVELTAALTVLNDGKQYKVKAFSWNGITEIKPYGQNAELE